MHICDTGKEAAAATRDDEICGCVGKDEGQVDASALGVFFHLSSAELLAMEAKGGDDKNLLRCDRNTLETVLSNATQNVQLC